ncbi:unnamed protein product [Sympodiomycopsis kandeliae]
MSSSSSSSSTQKVGSEAKSLTRLYITNIPLSYTEYNLIQLFKPYGKITSINIIFHKSGPLKNKSKGFGFLEFASKEDAMMAKVAVDGRVISGGEQDQGMRSQGRNMEKRLRVNFANHDPTTSSSSSSTGPIRSHSHSHKSSSSPPTQSTLSILKNAQRPQGGTSAKIAAMEAKLASLKQSKEKSNGSDKNEEADQVTDGAGKLARPPFSAGLPARPPPSSSSRPS